MSITTSAEFKPEDTSLNLFVAGPNKKRVFINKDKNSRDHVQWQLCDASPEAMLRAPFGISDPPKGVSDVSRLSLEVAVPSDSDIPSIINRLDAHILKYLETKCMDVFGKARGRELIESQFVSPYRETREEGKSNLLRLKIPEDCSVLCLTSFDHDTQELNCEPGTKKDIEKGCRLIPSVEISPMWFMAKDIQYGYSLTMTHVIVDKTNSTGRRQLKGHEAFIMGNGFSLQISENCKPESPKRPLERSTDDESPSSKVAKVQDGSLDLSIDNPVNTTDPHAYL